MLKVLVSAYACEPGRGSEPGVGWNWVQQIARFHKVWVITRSNNRGPIEGVSAKETIPNVHWVYFDLPYWMRFWKKGQRGIHLYYYLWQIGVYFVGKRLHKKVGFDLVHHVTFGTYWLPSFLMALQIPSLWGPLGGGDSAPKAFHSTFSLRGRIYEGLRDLARRAAHSDPFLRLLSRQVDLVLANTAETEKRLRALGCKRTLVYSHMGVSLNEVPRTVKLQSIQFRMASVGRLLHWKGFHLGLMAFANFQQKFPASEYWIIGDGPELRNLQRLARRLDVSNKVHFWGKLPRQKVLDKLTEYDLLVHPSLHDSAPAVCLEAMAAGRPVLCLDWGGPALQVTEETGIKVSALRPEQVVDNMAEAMLRLARDTDLRERLGEAARKRIAEHFDWDNKGEWINVIYQKVSLRECTL